MDKISNGDFQAYKRFMKKHPDPKFKCCEFNRGINLVEHSTIACVQGSGNLEMMKDYFTYNLSQKDKDDFLAVYWRDGVEYDETNRFLIEQGAKLRRQNFCDENFLFSVKKMHELGYDMNYIDPKSGRNIFLDFSAIGKDKEVFDDGACAVEILKYLKSIGVNTKLKDINGKTALEIASDPVVIEYLKTI